MQAATRKRTRPSKARAAEALAPVPAVAEPAGHEVISFGVRLRELRKRMGWTLQKASEVTGVPIATLSRIANEKVSPTLDVVMRIARGFNMSPADFFFSAPDPLGERTISISRAGHGRFAEMPNLIYHPLHSPGGPNSPVAILVTLFAKRPEDYGPLTAHPGEEFLYVLDGTLEVLFEGGMSHLLEAGDSLQFHSDIRHGYIAKGARQAKFLIVTVSSSGEFDFGEREGNGVGRSGAPPGKRGREPG
jgi:transcriptional regulator with XRE-family HTH domain